MFSTLIVFLILFSFSVYAQNVADSIAGTEPAYLDTNLSFEQRAADLVSRMTLNEKISQMQTKSTAIPRLGIHAYNWWNECLHGVARDEMSTVFPQVIGMAATWDVKLIHQEANVISTEARAIHNDAVKKDEYGGHQGLTFFAPNINIVRDPRWGRGQETYGEDPYLTSEMGIAFITGLQGTNPKYFKVIATTKHFAVHSGPELLRHKFNADVSKRDLFETYLPAFEACIKRGGAYSIMGAYSALNGVPDCANEYLLTNLLRKSWGFKGYVVSDCGAIGDIWNAHKYAPNLPAAASLAVKAGCDLSCGREGYSSLNDAVKKGLISEKDIDTAVTRLMLARMKLGMFDLPNLVPYSKITIGENNTLAHRELARKVADESIVLLKNADYTLPLNKDIKSVAVVGAYADNLDVLLGNYHGTPSNPVTIMQGIKNKLGNAVKVYFAAGYNPLEDKIINPETIGSEFLNPANNSQVRGLYAEYFNNLNSKGKVVFTEIDSTMNFNWENNSPGKNIRRNNFSVKLKGAITSPSSNLYRLGISSNQKCRLYFNGKLVLDNWKQPAENYFEYKIIALQKGRKYDIELDYAVNKEYAHLKLWWQKVRKETDPQILLKKALEVAKKSDMVIAVAGISPLLESEENNRIDLPGFKGGDRTKLSLPENEEELLKELNKTGKKIILVLVGGSALAINWEQENLPAIIDAWYPGEEGGDAVADVLFGDYNPSGRLPITFYKSVKDLPSFTNYSMTGRTYRFFRGKPLYPFGFGLSYTTFQYSDMKENRTTLNPFDTLIVTVNVQNTGKYDGDDVVELYVKNLNPKDLRLIKSLKGFSKVSIKKGRMKTVHISLPINSIKSFDENKQNYVVEPGKYELQIGSSSSNIKLRKIITIE
jgi:beta-glucosidase